MKIKIAASILSADFSKLGEEIKAVEKAGADLIHLDVMDGHFVPNLTIGPPVVKAIRKITKLPLDTHLMIENPQKYVEAFARAGSDIISFHAETTADPAGVIKSIKKLKIKPALVLNPATPLETIKDFIPAVEMILLMTVNPGFEGQKFMPEVLAKIRTLRQLAPNLEIEVDGGINLQTAPRAVQAGANILVAGSAVFWDDNYRKIIRSLKKS